MIEHYKRIREEYAFNGDVLCEDDPRVRSVKFIISEKLSQVDRTLILLYADCQSLREVAKMMGCSHTTIAHEIKRIRAEIKKYLKND